MNTPTREHHRNGLARLTRHGVVGAVTVTLAALSCYGVLALTALLPLLGIRLALDDSLWAGAIALFTVITAVAVLPGITTHGARIPALAAIVGAGLILHALLVDYDARVELAGFLVLAAAVIRDVQLHRRARRRRREVTPV